MVNLFMPGDKVNYVGQNQKILSEVGTKMGVISARVGGEPNGVVVDFGDDAYIVSVNSLRKLHRDVDAELPRRRSRDEE